MKRTANEPNYTQAQVEELSQAFIQAHKNGCGGQSRYTPSEVEKLSQAFIREHKRNTYGQ